MVLTSWNDLPETVPEEVRFACMIAGVCETAAGEAFGWGNLRGVFLQLRRTIGTPVKDTQVGIKPLEYGPHTTRTNDAIRRYVATARRPFQFPGQHTGVVMLTETVAGVPDDVEPEALDEAFADLVAAGARQGRVAVGVLMSGWRLTVTTYRHERGPRVVLLEPGEPWPERFGLAASMDALNDKLIMLG